jgi:hypothetical protein
MPISPTHHRRVQRRQVEHESDDDDDDDLEFQDFSDSKHTTPPRSRVMNSSQQSQQQSQSRQRRRQSLPWSMPPRSRETMLSDGFEESGSGAGGMEGATDELLVECVECGKWVKASSHGELDGLSC